VTGFSEGQLEVAHLLFGLPEALGFALAGGSALLALGAIDRPTRDIDAFVAARPETPPGDVGPLVAALRACLVGEGWTVTVDRALVTFARLLAERGDDAVEIDLAVDSPPLFPVEIVDELPVLAGQDLAARKVLAILDRVEGRDFTDLRALADRYSQSEIMAWARALDDGVSASEVAHAFDRIGRLADDELPCPTKAVPALRAWFQRWAADLVEGS
jgi:hypothetical protein